MRFRLIAVSLLFVIAAVASVWTRQAGPAQLALEAARKTEVVDRNLLAAIVQYRDVAAKYESDNSVAPAALLQLAGCYEQLHQPEARATYARIVKYYPNSAPARAARAKLENAQSHAELTVTRLLRPSDSAPSLDGRYFSETSQTSGDLVVRDAKSGHIRAVTSNSKKPSSNDYPLAFNAVPSPDGRQIAYGWYPRSRGDVTELRIINYDGSRERVLCCHEKRGEEPLSDGDIVVYGWSGDGKNVLFSFSGSAGGFELLSVPATGGVPHRLKQLRGVTPIFWAAWSPDSRFIVYDAAPTGREGPEHDLFIMRADGSNTEPLITHVAHKHMLHWFPDGQRILFVSDRSGSKSMWAQSIIDGKAVGEPTIVRPSVGDIVGHGFTRDGAYYYHVRSWTDDIFTARLDASGALSGKLEPLPSRFSGGKSDGVWSPDGSRIAYVRLPLDVNSEPSLSIQTVSTQEVHTIPLPLKGISHPAWMPDGLAMVVAGTNTEGRQGLFRIELRNGAVSPVGEPSAGSATIGSHSAISSNGREVFYALGQDGSYTKGLAAIQARDLLSGASRMVFDGPILNFALSPDGRFIAVASPNFRSATDQTPPFRIVPIAGGEMRAIGTELSPAFYESGFAWSADGRHLYFARSYPEERIRLWRVPVDGGPAQPTDIPLRQRVFRISVHPNGQLAISAQSFNIESWVMRNIPPAPKR